MAYQPTKLGSIVITDPAKAYSKLAALFLRHKTIQAVADSQNIDRHTVQRWLISLTKRGYADPRSAIIRNRESE